MKLHPAFTAANLGEGRFIFRGPFKNVVVSDRSGCLDALLPKLQSREPVADALREMADRDTAQQLIDSLTQRDIVVSDAIRQSDDPICDVLDLATRQAARLRGDSTPVSPGEHKVVVLAGGAKVEDAIKGFGADVVPLNTASRGDVALAILTSDNADAGERAEREATQAGLPTLFVLVDAYRILWGPVYIPGETASLSDLCYHWGLNALHAAGQHSDLLSLASPASPMAMQVALALAFVRVRAMAAGLSHLVPGGEVVEMDCLTFKSRKGQVLRMPRAARRPTTMHAPIRAAWVE